MKNMKKIVYYILGAAAMLAAASCAKNVNWDEVSPATGQEGEITLRFSSGEMKTKADGRLAVNREDYVKQIEYFIFPATEQTVEGEDGKSTTSLVVADNAEFVYHGKISVASGNELKLKYDESFTPSNADFAKIFPDGATKAKVFAVANYASKEIVSEVVDGYMTVTDIKYEIADVPAEAKTWKALHELEVDETFIKDGGKGFGYRWPRVMQPDTYTVTKGEGDNAVKEDKNDDLFFVMVGEEDLVLDPKEGASAEVSMERLASKVTVEFTYSNFVEEKSTGNITWVPQDKAGEARVYLSNVISKSTLGGPISNSVEDPLVEDDWGTLLDGSRDLFEYAYDFLTSFKEGELPFYYTYPYKMSDGDTYQPYLKLVIPWYGYKNYGTDQQILYKQKEVYYKIVLPRESLTKGNRIYQYKVAVNIMGSDKEVEVTGEQYKVLNWSSDTPVASNVATGRFISLDIPKEEYDMYTDEVQIKFVSSGQVVISDIKIYQDNFSNADATQDMYMDGTVTYSGTTATYPIPSPYSTDTEDIAGVKLPDWVKVSGSNLVVKHHMNNDFTDKAVDVTPFHFIVTLHLKDATDDQFDRTVHITQYPAIYVQPEKSNGVVYVKGNTSEETVGFENIWDDYYSGNPDPGTDYDGNHYLGSVVRRDLGSATNKNTNQYTVTLTILDPEKNKVSVGSNSLSMMIGDPRGSEAALSNMSELGNKYVAAADNSQAIIAPKLRIASSYGASDRFTYEGAMKRCAAYQENGYPAGRWRLPTLAEIQFLITLSENEKIPTLFSPTSRTSTFNRGGIDGRGVHTIGYWSSGGWLYYGGSTAVKSIGLSGETPSYTYAFYDYDPYQTMGGWVVPRDYGYTQRNGNTNYFYFGATRCVYDEWYWGSQKYGNDKQPIDENDTTTPAATEWLGYMTSK